VGQGIKEGAGVSNTDSFIDEVTEEVRRDRLFVMARRYGWIALVAVLAVVGGAAYSEWTKAQSTARAKAAGDAVLAALDAPDPAARVAALALAGGQAEARVVTILLAASEAAASGDASLRAEAGQKLEALASDGRLPVEWRDLAAFRLFTVPGLSANPQDRRAGLEGLATDGRPFAALAREQLAILALEMGDIDSARAGFAALAEDQQAPAGLRSRARQMGEILGGTRPAQGN
jgi:hypothetical protein